MKKVVSFVARDFKRECSFVLEEKVSKETLDMFVKNAVYVMSEDLSNYKQYSNDLIKAFKEKDENTLKQLKAKRDKELKLGEERIGVVIIWEDHTFIPYDEIKKNGLAKYIKDFVK